MHVVDPTTSVAVSAAAALAGSASPATASTPAEAPMERMSVLVRIVLCPPAAGLLDCVQHWAWPVGGVEAPTEMPHVRTSCPREAPGSLGCCTLPTVMCSRRFVQGLYILQAIEASDHRGST